ncbi:MAG TPA: hypothetical protein VHH34_06470 [Pseudonocardiaceae bacterium]|nr:hypothetical protein [Pseudonocardiaceae bacterium]
MTALRRAISAAAAELGVPMKDLTVLAPQSDPFRVDTPARHRDGEWLAITARELGLGNRRIHLRGLHYMILGRPKPTDGKPYTNTDADWQWLSGHAGKAARWLGYLPFEQIVDQRNTPPVVRIFGKEQPQPYITVGIDVQIPDVDEITPQVGIDDFTGRQPYRLVVIGEKASLGDVLAPITDTYGADLYLPTGEISDTLLYQMARIGAEDGRPMVVAYLSDCDPAGWQMAVSVGCKLMALKAGLFPGLQFEMYRVALTPDQVREYGLPSIPLKDTERRADRWQSEMGVAQTEIDALASLRPDLLAEIVRQALDPFFDATLDRRVIEAESRWLDNAQAVIDAQIDAGWLEQLRGEAAHKLAAMQAEIDELNRSLRLNADDIDHLPAAVVPAADVLGRGDGTPLLDSRWSFAEQCRRLIDSKAYRESAA